MVEIHNRTVYLERVRSVIWVDVKANPRTFGVSVISNDSSH